MQRPNRPGRFHDPNWKHSGVEDYSGPELPSPESRILRTRERFDNRYDPREPQITPVYKFRSTRRVGWGNEPFVWSSPDSNLFKPIFTYSHQPPRPRSPPPPSSIQNEPMPGPSSGNNYNYCSNDNRATAEKKVTSENRTTLENKNDVINRLLSILECPVCFEYVSPPILQCQEGHLVCSGCRSKLDHCPKCRQPFADIRARTLEQVAEIVPYPCPHAGCTAMLSLSDRQAHDQVCPYRTYHCTMDLCLWMGRRSALPQHMAQDHPDFFIKSDTHDIILNLTHANEEKVFLMQCYDELFHCVMGVDCQQNIFLGFVMYLGPCEKASDYKFELNFRREDPPYTAVTIARTVLEESVTGTQLRENSGVQNDVIISFSTLREVIQDDGRALALSVHISLNKRQEAAES